MICISFAFWPLTNVATAPSQLLLELFGFHSVQPFGGRQAGTLELCSVLVTVALMSPQNIMFYDMGSGSTVCTIVTYQTVKTKDAGMQPQLQIRGVG